MSENSTSSFTEEEIKLIMEIKSKARATSLVLTHRLGTGMIIAGGCFTSWIHEEKANDIDIFTTSCTSKCTLHEISVLLRESDSRDKKYDDSSINSNIIRQPFSIDTNGKTFSELSHHLGEPVKDVVYHDAVQNATYQITNMSNRIQFIDTSYKDRKELIESFDFLHTKVSYDMDSDKLFISKDTFDAIRNKRLIANNIGISTPRSWRVEKFKSRGWKLESLSGQLTSSLMDLARQLPAGNLTVLPANKVFEKYKTISDWKSSDDWATNFPDDWKSKWPISSF